MKFSASLPEFQKVILTALQAIPPKSTLPVLEHFHFVLAGTTLTITATDQELTIVSSLEVEGNTNGEVLIPARRLADIAKALGNTGRIMLSSDAKTMKITLKTEYGEYTLNGLDANEFPNVPDFSVGAVIALSAHEAMKIARTASFAASKDEYRPAMTGLLLEGDETKLSAVTTDGFRLVRVTLSANGKSLASRQVSVILPVRAVDLLKKVDEDISMLVSATHAKFVIGSTIVITRVIDEKFPPYESVIPNDNDKSARFQIGDLTSAVKRVSLFANPNTKQIRFQLDTNKLTSFAEDIETGNRGQEDMMCDYNGAKFEIGFNYRYIEEAIAHLSDTGASKAVITFSTPNRATLIKPLLDEQESEDVLMLVMPVRL
jgi:DNA polymerase-3 subunit beta